MSININIGKIGMNKKTFLKGVYVVSATFIAKYGFNLYSELKRIDSEKETKNYADKLKYDIAKLKYDSENYAEKLKYDIETKRIDAERLNYNIESKSTN